MGKERIDEIRKMHKHHSVVASRHIVMEMLDALEKAQHEIETDDRLIAELERLLSAIPECPTHGRCIPHAIEYVEKMQAENERLRGNNADWTEEATQDVAALEEKHGIELVSIVFCEQLNDNFQAEQRENERLREALRNLEPGCRREIIITMGGDDQHSTSECTVCGAWFDSRRENDRHGARCPFKIMEPT